MPAISDPGEDLVRLASKNDISVQVVPGPTALISALALSALSTKRFAFEGFLSAKKNERKAHLSSLVKETRTLVFYEAPHKLKATLSDMLEIFGAERKISLSRELTKLNEEVIRTTLRGAVSLYEEKEPRGEYVLVLEGCQSSDDSSENEELSALSPREHIAYYLNLGMSKMDAIKAAAKDRKIPKSEMYKLDIENK